MNKKILLVLIIILSIAGIFFSIIARPGITFDKLSLSNEEWNSIISSRKEGDISLKKLSFNDYELIIDEDSSRIYYSVINNSQSKFTPFVSYSANTAGAKLAMLDDEMTEDKIMNNHEFKLVLYDNNSYKIYGLYCTSFPMLNVVYDNKENTSDYNISMSINLFNNFDNGINRIVKSDGVFSKVSSNNDEVNYKFSLVMTTPGNKERENVISLLRMRPSYEYYLNAVNIGTNEKPTFEKLDRPNEEMNIPQMPQQMSGEPIPDMRENDEQMVELFINNKYIGLYSLGYDQNSKVKLRKR